MTAALPLDESLQHSLTTRQTSNFWFEHGLVTTTDVALLYLNELHVCNSLVSQVHYLTYLLCVGRALSDSGRHQDSLGTVPVPGDRTIALRPRR